jgi:hypothetical protein
MDDLATHLRFSVIKDTRESRRLARRLLVFAAVHLGDQATGSREDDRAIECLLELAERIRL